MNGHDKAMNLVVFNANGFLMNSDQMEVLQDSYHPWKYCQALSIHCSILELTNSPQGVSHPVLVTILFRFGRSLLLIWSSQMKSQCWPHERQIEPLWLFAQLLAMNELNSAENQFFSREPRMIISTVPFLSVSAFHRLITSFPYRSSIRTISAATANERPGSCVEWPFALQCRWSNS
jgi:hypothetical protein